MFHTQIFKFILLTLIFATLILPADALLINTRVLVGGSDGTLGLDGRSFDSSVKSLLSGSIRRADGLCRGSLSLRFYGENEKERMSFEVNSNLNDGCFITQDWLFFSTQAQISYRITPKTKRIITGNNKAGYPIWETIFLGERVSKTYKDDVALLLVDGGINLISDTFTVYDIHVDKFTVTQ